MAGLRVSIVRNGIANLASVLAGMRRAGAEPHVTEDAKEVEQGSAVILPGVGAFAAGMEALRRHGLVEILRQRIADGRPTLAVCLGLQLLCETSEESPGESGLGAVATQATRFPNTVRVPQLGWNRVEPEEGCRLLQPGYAYFANSFRVTQLPDGWHAARSDHAGPFVAAFERGPVLACQFHPELSGRWGLALLERWLAAAEGGAAC